jgi:amino acid adenylation domain-containing protein
MTIVAFLAQLRRQGVRLWVEGERLRYSAPDSVLTPDLRAELAARKVEILTFLGAAGTHQAALPIPPARRGDHMPLSFAQQRLWFIDQLAPGMIAYAMPQTARLRGQLQLDALAYSFAALVRRHEMLRTTFGVVEGRPVQISAPADRAPLPLLSVLDLRALAPVQREAVALRLAAQQTQTPFDLARGPLLRITLLRLNEDTHLLTLTLHHIIADAWSLDVLIRELVAFYEGRLTGTPPALPALPIQYADYASWQRDGRDAAALAAQRDYWTRQLAALPTLALPTDRPRPPVQHFRGAQWTFDLYTISDGLQALGQQEGATLFMTLLAAFLALLQRYTAQDDLVIGTPIAGRTHAEVEQLIGLFINTLVLRVDLAGDPSFRALLGRTRTVALAAFANPDLPFEQLVEELQPLRDPSRHPLFQVLFVIQNPARPAIRLTNLTLQPLNFDSGTAKLDLTLTIIDAPQGLHAALEYNTDLFDQPTIARMARHIQTLLAAIVAQPDQRLAHLPLLTSAERQQLLSAWNDTRAGMRGACVHELFATQATRTPDAVALVYETKDAGRRTNGESASCVLHLTYAELDRRANQLARHLRALGVGPEVRVGLCLDRTPELLIGLLGILKAGGAYLPLDPTYPAERLAFMLEDSQVGILLTQERLLDRLPALWALVVAIDAEWPAIATQPTTCPTSGVTPANLAYLIYTSGSTGQPKGVLVAHAGLDNLAAAQIQAFTVQPNSRVLQFAALGFDAAVSEIAMALLAGAALVLADQDDRLPGPQLLRLLHDQAITTVTLPPSALAALPSAALPALRTMIAAGEECSAAIIARWGPGRRMVNAYGPTEATVCATLHVSADHARAPAIGRPLPNVQVYLLDPQLRPTPIGVPGELFIGGVGLARGYLGRPDLTAERFVPNPFVTTEDERRTTNDETAERPVVLRPSSCVRLYRTGDLARYRADGQIMFLGRRDQQVKLRGFRIELGEIEAALRAHPAVQTALVLARADTPGDQRLVAYVVTTNDERRMTNDERDPSVALRPSSVVADLRGFLQRRLPDYMLPSAFVLLDALPRTPNGKLDRAALPPPDVARPLTDDSFVAPRSPTEALLAQIWADLLRLDRVGVDDNFFALGGHSLLATQLIARLRETFQIELAVHRLFAAPTLGALAEQIADEQRTQRGLSTLPLTPAVRDGAMPLSFAQQRLWFVDRLAPGNPFYNLPAAVRLTGLLNLAVFRQSLRALVRRHETLRTTFATIAGQPVQLIAAADAVHMPLRLIDLSGLPSERERLARELARTEMLRPFDLARGPLLRTTLMRLDQQEHVLLLTLHHIIADGWSMAVLVHEIATTYAAGTSGTHAALPALPIQYADFASWQRAWLQGEVLDAQLAYWKDQLAGSPNVLDLPTDRPRPAVQSYRGAAYTFELDHTLLAALNALSRRAGTTLFMTLLAAFDVLMYRYSGQTDLVVGSPIAGRTQPATEALIGCFVNTLVLRSDLAGDPSFHELLGRVRALCLDAYTHQDLPFERLVEELQPARELSRHPLFQVEFALQNMPTPALTASELTLRPLAIAGETAKFDLVLGVTEHAAGMLASWEYCTDLFDATTIRHMSAHWRTLLTGIVAAPERRLADLPLLTSAERQQLLVDWNATQVAYPLRLFHEQAAAQAAHAPDAIALVCQETKDEGRKTKGELSGFVLRPSSCMHLTYAELDRRANQLAHHLQALGVGPEVRVGLCSERSLELVIGLLGIFKAGGAYVPLDPAYPIERLAFMLADAQLPVLLTQERLIDQLPSHSALELFLDSDWPLIARSPSTAPASAVGPDNLAYVIYTSGSTGQPKGVLVAQRGLCNLLGAQRDVFALPADSRILQFASLSFDAALYEIVTALTSGALMCLAPADALLPGAGLIKLLHDQAITSITIPPSALAVMQPAGLAALRTIIVAGEACPAAVVALWGAGRRLFNCYGPTEATIWSTFERCASDGRAPAIGRPIPNAQLYLLDAHLRPTAIGVPGEVFIGGAGLARGYLDRPTLTAARFVPNPFGDCRVQSAEHRLDQSTSDDRLSAIGYRLYKTGDLARYRPDGAIEFLGRIDQQVKLRGFRIELGEVEAQLLQHPAIGAAAVVVREERPGDPHMVAYVVATNGESADSSFVLRLSSLIPELRAFLKERLPEYMLPSAFVPLDALPRTPNGKLDRKALPAPAARALPAADQSPQTELERTIAAIWQEVLQIETVGRAENFFDLGGHSLRMVAVQHTLQARLQREIAIVDLFRYPTISALADFLGGGERTSEDTLHHSQERAAQRRALLGAPPEPPDRPGQQARRNGVAAPAHASAPDIAIIGMSGRFPGAPTLDAFWQNLRDGVEAITFFSDDELLAAGVSPARLRQPQYVKARGVLAEIEQFDAAFFGYSPREAELLDPQQRLFLECAWEALERAGYAPTSGIGAVGVYAGIGMNHYWLNLAASPELIETLGSLQAAIANDRDFFATRISYKLNLRGPSITVQTACSTSLVAVHLACQSLLHGECDLALAGGISLAVPAQSGYLYTEGGIGSPDGHCRAFDVQAQGCVGGSGMGIVVLKRLAAALADRDPILAVIKGSAVNNDGAAKVGYTAPSIDGQAAVIAEALAVAAVPAATIGYVEAHGTGTTLGDPIEVAALTHAFRASSDQTGFCALGSVKTNIGHLDAAAGVTGLIKAVLALQNGQIPPSLHFNAPNPQIDLANSPFFVPTGLRDWPAQLSPRRAGVSAFGLGGTNAHVVLEAAPAVAATAAARPCQLLVLSAKTATALATATDNLAAHLAAHPQQELADVAYTLQAGRTPFAYRRVLVCTDLAQAQAALASGDPAQVLDAQHDGPARPVVFMFPGQGAQHAGMGHDLYASEPRFRAVVDQCCELLAPQLGCDLREIIYPRDEGRRTQDESEPSSFVARRSSELLNQTQYAQPALFVVEYALAQLWMAWGVMPEAMIGLSLGEYVAACLAGVLALDDALALVAARGRLMQALPSGAMLSVRLPAAEVQPLLGSDLALAAINAPALCVVAGPPTAISAFHEQLGALGVECQPLHTSHAFHSAMLDPILGLFAEQLRHVTLRPPRIPYLSNLTGDWITASQATDPAYWVAHLRQPVRFADGIAALLADPERILLEVGPDQTLSMLARQQAGAARVIVASQPRPTERQPGAAALLAAAGKLWLAGATLDWTGLHAGAQPRRVCLPTYPFERQRYWIDARSPLQRPALAKQADIADWFYLPVWKRMPLLKPPAARAAQRRNWLVFSDESGLGQQLCARLLAAEQNVVAVRIGAEFRHLAERGYTLNPSQPADYTALIYDLALREQLPDIILHLWSVLPDDGTSAAIERIDQCQERGMFSLVYLAQALERGRVTAALQLVAVSNRVQSVRGDEATEPWQAAILGPCIVIPQEYPNIRCRSIDVVLPAAGESQQLVDQLLAESSAPPPDTTDTIVAYRGQHRWVQSVEAVRLADAEAGRAGLRTNGVYLITGGLGQVGLALAAGLARVAQARLVLLGRTALPERATWDDWLAQHPADDELSRKIRGVQALEAQGSQVLTISADVADEPQMRAAIAQAEARFGRINGVIHAAGLTGPAAIRTISETDRAVAEQHFRPKLRGMAVLATLLADHPLDFCLLQSSLAAVAGGLGFCAYAAANCVLDALAQHQQYQPRPAGAATWRSINWDGWHFGDAATSAAPARAPHSAILPAEGVGAFERLLALDGIPQVIVSTTDLPQRLARWRTAAAERAATPDTSTADTGMAEYPRPPIATLYVAPSDARETMIAAIWQATLGIAPIGIHDNFFDLGGHSLLATQVVSRLRERMQVEVPLHELFETPTVAGLARSIAARQDQPHLPLVRRIAPLTREPEDALINLDRLSEVEIDTLLDALSTEEETHL